MPNRRGHTYLTLGLLFPLAVGSYFWPTIAPACLGVFATLPFRIGNAKIYLNPDMDIAANDNWIADSLGLDAYQSEISHRAGLKRSDWVGIRKHPAKIFLLSHIPGFGTLPRFLPVFLILLLVSSIMPINATVYVSVFIGMTVSDLIHVIADLSWSGIKKGLRNKNGSNRANDVGYYRSAGWRGGVSLQRNAEKRDKKPGDT